MKKIFFIFLLALASFNSYSQCEVVQADIYACTLRVTEYIPGTAATILGRTTGGEVVSVALPKQIEVYSGTTSGSGGTLGTYTVSFPVSYSIKPNIQVCYTGSSDIIQAKVTSITSSGFTITARQRNDVIGLLPSYTSVNGASFDVVITPN